MYRSSYGCSSDLPDVAEAAGHVLPDHGDGSFARDIPLPRAAHSGEWSVSAHASTGAEAIGRAYFEVQDFVPPRIEFDLSSAAPRAEPEIGRASCRERVCQYV